MIPSERRQNERKLNEEKKKEDGDRELEKIKDKGITNGNTIKEENRWKDKDTNQVQGHTKMFCEWVYKL